MAKFSSYNISLKNFSPEVHSYSFALDKKFFEAIDGEEVRKGTLQVELKVKKVATTYEFDFDIHGIIQIPCDRCLDEMDQKIDTHNRLIVKMGREYAEESDEIVIIPEEEGEINIAWFLYEFIALNIPIKHVHEPGKCNRNMTKKLHRHTVVTDEGEESGEPLDEGGDTDFEDNQQETTDPRWDVLKGIDLDE
ncbi:YceD family protein [Anaerorudis cellulosivorans]|uniref:YceD family protein n=1 Tax=Anaerorudis cellulosivorans TaxID=3397862 RepID=UPI0022209E7D|nr:DUF177 domain-containing protein [Seramator thermalis]MCW1734377.1 DUF177 domain-containing protein [Seramator thermalis]